MKNFIFAYLYLALAAPAVAQLTIVSTSPTNNATNVSLNTVLSTTFSSAVDTTSFVYNQSVYSNIDSTGDAYYSADGKTVYTPIFLKANTMYFGAITYAKAKDGSTLESPYVMYFTTGSTFPPYSVSGTVLSGSTGVSPQNSIVALSKTSPMESDNPIFVSWANVNTNGTFTIPYVASGKYWIIAAKDVDLNGQIDPGQGVDAIAFGDTIIVNNGSLTNVTLTFVTAKPVTFADALPIADSLAKNLPSDRLLKNVQSSNTDTLGRTDNWHFLYTHNSNTAGSEISVSMFSETSPIDNLPYLNGLTLTKTLLNPETAANSSVVITNVENAGGKSFRHRSHPDSMTFRIDMSLGDMSHNDYQLLSPDANQLYWGVTYSYVVEKQSELVRYNFIQFLCSFSTGAVRNATSVSRNPGSVPSSFLLAQNYPNPFNPSTMINYQLPMSNYVTLKVHDLLGREVATLVNEKEDPGTYSVKWDASKMSSGIYFCRLTAGSLVQVRKMLFVK